jgi:hypothetical protein
MRKPDPPFDPDEIMDEILAEASDPMSPTLTPFVALGADDQADTWIAGPVTPKQTQAHDLWETLGE